MRKNRKRTDTLMNTLHKSLTIAFLAVSILILGSNIDLVGAQNTAANKKLVVELSDEENARLFGPCNNKNGHGHNYDLFVTVRGPVDPVTGMVMNLFDLHTIVKQHIFDVVDHKHLDEDLDILGGRTSTAENLAVVFWEIVQAQLGPFPGVEYEHAVKELRSGDRIFMYTDGIVEAANGSDEQFGAARLREVLVGSQSPLSILLFEI